MSKHAGGRPRNWNPEQVREIIKKFSAYIDSKAIPIIAEFCYQNNIICSELYDYPEFSNVLKKCRQKKEANLENGALTNQVNTAMAIFSLKQLGWSDKQVIHNFNANLEIPVSPEDFEAFKANLKEFFPNVDLSDLENQGEKEDH